MKFRWDKKYLYWGITAFCVVVASALVIWAFGRWQDLVAVINFILGILAPILAGLVIAYLLNPILRFFDNVCFTPLFKRLCKKKPERVPSLSRGVSVGVTMGPVILVIVGILALVLPEFYHSLEGLVGRLPSYLEVGMSWVQGLFKTESGLEQSVLDFLRNAVDYLSNWIENSLLPQADAILVSISSGVISVVKGVINFVIGLVVSVYVMYNKEKFFAQSKKLLCATCKPKRVENVLRNVRYLHKSFGEYFVGMLINSLIIGVCTAIFMVCLDMPYAALITVFVTVTNVIPFLGPFIGAIPSAFLILLEDPLKCLIFVIFIAVLQFIECNIISPKILGVKTGLSGFWIVFAILLGGGLFGFLGMVCAVPVFSFLYFVIKNACNRGLEKKNMPTETSVYAALHLLDEKSEGVSGLRARKKRKGQPHEEESPEEVFAEVEAEAAAETADAEEEDDKEEE